MQLFEQIEKLDCFQSRTAMFNVNCYNNLKIFTHVISVGSILDGKVARLLFHPRTATNVHHGFHTPELLPNKAHRLTGPINFQWIIIQ